MRFIKMEGFRFIIDEDRREIFIMDSTDHDAIRYSGDPMDTIAAYIEGWQQCLDDTQGSAKSFPVWQGMQEKMESILPVEWEECGTDIVSWSVQSVDYDEWSARLIEYAKAVK